MALGLAAFSCLSKHAQGEYWACAHAIHSAQSKANSQQPRAKSLLTAPSEPPLSFPELVQGLASPLALASALPPALALAQQSLALVLLALAWLAALPRESALPWTQVLALALLRGAPLFLEQRRSCT